MGSSSEQKRLPSASNSHADLVSVSLNIWTCLCLSYSFFLCASVSFFCPFLFLILIPGPCLPSSLDFLSGLSLFSMSYMSLHVSPSLLSPCFPSTFSLFLKALLSLLSLSFPFPFLPVSSFLPLISCLLSVSLLFSSSFPYLTLYPSLGLSLCLCLAPTYCCKCGGSWHSRAYESGAVVSRMTGVFEENK